MERGSPGGHLPPQACYAWLVMRAAFLSPQGLHPGSGLMTSQRLMATSSMRSPWRPSPCERRYRLHGWTLPHRLLWRLRRFRFMAITTRVSVELLTFASLRKPPTFTRLDSATHLRWWFPANPSRSLRYPERHQGTRSLPSALQINLMQPLGRQLRRICLGTPS